MDKSMQQNSLIRGSNCWVWAGESASKCVKIGYCDSFRASKSYQLQRANGIGELLTFSIDPQGYQVTCSMSGFIPTKSVVGATTKNLRGQGDASLLCFDVSVDDYVEEKVTKFPYICLKDKASDSVICEITDAIEQNFNISAQGASYIKGDISFEAIDMNSPAEMKEYESVDDMLKATTAFSSSSS